MPALTQPSIGGPPPVLPDLPPFGGDNREEPGHGSVRSASLIGIIVLMCASTMTFGALVAAMMLRRSMNNDWHTMPVPSILWWNTVVLLLSSVALDAARRRLQQNRRALFNWYWSAGSVLGTMFLIGQVLAWRELHARGYFLAGGLATAFFYVITWSHAAHVVGALVPVYYVEFRALRLELGPSRRTMVAVSALFWHFLDLVWLGIMGLFAWWA